MRLINADELMELYDCCDGLSVPIAVVQQNIKDATTIDVAPVIHGHWEKYGIDIPEHPWHCSECGWGDHHIEQRRIQEFKACPNCGAKMDGGKVK